MKRINVNDIEIGKTYYEICVGMIREIVITDITDIKIKIYDVVADYEKTTHQSDAGLDCPTSYNNTLNTIVETYFEALQIISDVEYKANLKRHFRSCNLDSGLFYD